MRLHLAIGTALILASSLAQAQYKYVDQNGRTVYSDRPPPAGTKGVQKKDIAGGGGVSASGPTVDTTGFPFALANAAKNFPVTIFTQSDCAGCTAARTYLQKRGVPFTEKSVKTDEDLKAMREAIGTVNGIPGIAVGRTSKFSGYDEGALAAALDVAGYPGTSQLPPNYRAPALSSAAPPKPEAPAKPPAGGEATAAAPAAPAPAAPAADRPSWFKGF
jgi:glutaredoxin